MIQRDLIARQPQLVGLDAQRIKTQRRDKRRQQSANDEKKKAPQNLILARLSSDTLVAPGWPWKLV
jgi:hypothetical protein